ncbi:uncharacterized protein LOC127740611 isoform X2 [Arachis duranensis]|uniref:Uncharacterized protein LOC127740611 isoform X2 n=1 Tax=Arachis duranensis TaxID=130453 RepID=A0A9C6WMY3_ARADU|nr:uncharacterized protein LOC127740611 isoform X2 [Arachis duranensis]
MVGCSATLAAVTARSCRHGCRLPNYCVLVVRWVWSPGESLWLLKPALNLQAASTAEKTLPPPLSPKIAAQSSVLEFIASCRCSGHRLRRWCYRNRHRCCRYLVPLSTVFSG